LSFNFFENLKKKSNYTQLVENNIFLENLLPDVDFNSFEDFYKLDFNFIEDIFDLNFNTRFKNK
jgi:hypothetical protein